MIEKRSKLGESQTLQQFSRDVDEIEAWISEKLQTATDESYKDPTNIQVQLQSPVTSLTSPSLTDLFHGSCGRGLHILTFILINADKNWECVFFWGFFSPFPFTSSTAHTSVHDYSIFLLIYLGVFLKCKR